MSKERRHLRFLITSALLVGPALGCGGPEPEPSTVGQPTGNPVGPVDEEGAEEAQETLGPPGTQEEEEEPPTGNPGYPEPEVEHEPDPPAPDSLADQVGIVPSVNLLPSNHPGRGRVTGGGGGGGGGVATMFDTIDTPPSRVEPRPRVNTKAPPRVPRPAPLPEPTSNPGVPQPDPAPEN